VDAESVFDLNFYGEIAMTRTIAFLAVIGCFCAVGSAHALYSVSNRGEWPNSWPKELEPLRKQSRTLVGPVALNQHFAIPFTKREEFESAWPHILKVKSKGAPVRLVRGPNFFLGAGVKAGVVVHGPPAGQEDNPAVPKCPISIDLVVDGDIVDLNRIALPADTPIIDERFKDGKNK
jgi:hypothetical protein